MIELKSCPFCGSDAAIAVSKDLGVCVRCINPDCGCQTKYETDNFSILGNWPDKAATDEVIKRWNNRSINKDE